MTFDKRGDDVVVLFAGFVVLKGASLQRFLELAQTDLFLAVGFGQGRGVFQRV